jgi:hypothetical protein
MCGHRTFSLSIEIDWFFDRTVFSESLAGHAVLRGPLDRQHKPKPPVHSVRRS